MHTTILTDREIRARLQSVPPLVEGLRDEASQIQPCGVDLTVRTISCFVAGGTVDFDNSGRALPERAAIPWKDNFISLPPGAYHVVYNEVVNLPRDVMALAYPRSSLLRCGVTLYTAVWDPGYSGRAESLLVVHNPCGFRLGEGARVTQLVFNVLGSDVQSVYNGRFRNENLGS